MIFMPITSDLREALGRAAATSLLADARRWSRAWGVPELLDEVRIERNPRLSSTVARYRRDKDQVELGPRFFQLRSRRREILAHELAHAAVQRVFGHGSRVHGPEWRELLLLSGFRPSARLSLTKNGAAASNPPLRGSRHFAHRCPVCHMVRYARRPVPAWKCASCVRDGLAGELVIAEVGKVEA